jgi:hypothetical protein
MKKLWFDILLAVCIVLLMVMHFKNGLDNDVQVILFKMVQVNIGLIHMWIAGRLFFGKVDWENEVKFTPKNGGRLIMLLVIVGSYALGG